MNNKPIVVQKYGGSSLANPEYIQHVAENIVKRKDSGVNMVVVVSAMGKTTDEFVKMAHAVNPNPDKREMDMLLSVGERISISLLALAINATGKYRAVSYTGSQIGLITDDNHTNARVLEVKGHRLYEALNEDKIVVIAGFQGVSVNKEITTLGRGGSDTTAVAVAASLNAECCEIMSDIDGIYTADPKTIAVTKRIDRIDYKIALEMAAAGARMLHKTAVEFAGRHHVQLSLGSTFTGQIGTIVTDEKLNKGCVAAVVTDKDLVLFRVSTNQEDGLKYPLLFSCDKVPVKIWQLVHGSAIIGVSQSDLPAAKKIIEKTTQAFSIDSQYAVLSLIGAGINIGTTAACRFFTKLNELNVKYSDIINGELYLKVFIPLNHSDKITEEIHNLFFS